LSDPFALLVFHAARNGVAVEVDCIFGEVSLAGIVLRIEVWLDPLKTGIGKRVKYFYVPYFLHIRWNYSGVSQTSGSGMKMRMSMEGWWSDTDRVKPKYWEKNLFHPSISC
jgi:hypothetical protein